jgi:hypothetical protein
MNSVLYREPQSLLEVRQWKEEVYQETKDLTAQEYLKRLDQITIQIKEKYHLSLQKVNLSPV